MTALDLDFVRSQFPAFSEPSLAGWAHFENAGGSYACGQVIEQFRNDRACNAGNGLLARSLILAGGSRPDC